MPIYQTATYQVKPSAVGKVTQAIQDLVRYVQANEPGTEIYLAWQAQSDPTKFVHLFMFAGADARARHSKSEAVQRYKAAYTPELVCGDVVFTDFQMVAGRR